MKKPAPTPGKPKPAEKKKPKKRAAPYVASQGKTSFDTVIKKLFQAKGK